MVNIVNLFVVLNFGGLEDVFIITSLNAALHIGAWRLCNHEQNASLPPGIYLKAGASNREYS